MVAHAKRHSIMLIDSIFHTNHDHHVSCKWLLIILKKWPFSKEFYQIDEFHLQYGNYDSIWRKNYFTEIRSRMLYCWWNRWPFWATFPCGNNSKRINYGKNQLVPIILNLKSLVLLLEMVLENQISSSMFAMYIGTNEILPINTISMYINMTLI